MTAMASSTEGSGRRFLALDIPQHSAVASGLQQPYQGCETMAKSPQIPIPPFRTRSFETAAAMVEWQRQLRAAAKQADARIQPWQAALDEGDKQHMDDLWPTRVYGWGYSIYCADGEPGSTHRATFDRKLSEDEFAAALKQCRDTAAVYTKFAGQK